MMPSTTCYLVHPFDVPFALFLLMFLVNNMKHAIIVAATALSLVAALWAGFSLGVYYHARTADAFTANQILLVRHMLAQREDPMASAKHADEIATRWEMRAENTSLLEAFDPHNVPSLLSLSGEKRLLQHNHEIREQFLVATSQQ